MRRIILNQIFPPKLFVGIGFIIFFLSPIDSISQTLIQVSKNGNDIEITWAGGVPNHGVIASDSDAQFQNGETFAQDLATGPYIYQGGLTNGKNLEFFQVSGQNEIGPGTQRTGGAVPPVTPTILTVNPNSGIKVGDIITISGRGFSTFPKANVVHFGQGITVTSETSPAPTETSFDVLIPRGALSGSFWVQVGSQISAPTNLTILAADGFRFITQVDYLQSTEEIFVTDRSGGVGNPSSWNVMGFSSDIWGITDSGTPADTINSIGSQGFDSSGSWFLGENNGSNTSKWNPPGIPAPYSLLPDNALGITSSKNLADEAFFLFFSPLPQEGGRIYKLGPGGIIDSDFGNLNDPPGTSISPSLPQAGIVLSDFGDLYLPETTAIGKIRADETYLPNILDGFCCLSGLDIEHVNPTDPGVLLVTENWIDSFGRVQWVDLNNTTLESAVIRDDLGGTISSSFASFPQAPAICAGLPSTDLSFIFIGEGDVIRQQGDPRISIVPMEPTRLWISKNRADDDYPTVYQLADHQVTVTAQIFPVPSPARNVCLRIVDPPDLAPYADGINTGYWCDNRDSGGAAGTFVENSNSVYCALTDSNGEVTARLNATDRYAGDNYIVQASYDDWTTNNSKALSQTGVITSWKRGYIEKDKMFRKGGLLAQDAAVNDTSIILYDWADLPGCTNTNGPVPCAHIDLFDTNNSYESDHDRPWVSYYIGAGPGLREYFLVDNGMSPYSLQYSYDASLYPLFASTQGNNPAEGLSAGVGVFGSGFFQGNLGALWSSYTDAFVDFRVYPEGASTVPFIQSAFFDDVAPFAPLNWARFITIWFDNYIPDLGPEPDTNLPRNYFYLLGSGDSATRQGTSKLDYDYHIIFEMFIEAIGGLSFRINQDTTNHEFGHNFQTNYCTSGRHDSRSAWCDSLNNCGLGTGPEDCLMHSGSGQPTSQIEDGISRFCLEDLLEGDPNCSGTPPEGAIRTMPDPQ